MTSGQAAPKEPPRSMVLMTLVAPASHSVAMQAAERPWRSRHQWALHSTYAGRERRGKALRADALTCAQPPSILASVSSQSCGEIAACFHWWHTLMHVDASGPGKWLKTWHSTARGRSPITVGVAL